jgi:hypothetical protein
VRCLARVAFALTGYEMGRFDSSIATAKRLIERNGQKVTWRQFSEVTNDATPWKPTAGEPVDFPDISICFLPTDRIGVALLESLANTDLVTGSYYGLMGAVAFEPSVKDVVIRDGKEIRITAVDLLSPNGQKVLYTVQFDA